MRYRASWCLWLTCQWLASRQTSWKFKKNLADYNWRQTDMVQLEKKAWRNCCNHPDCSYVGSFGEFDNVGGNMQSFDLYVFDDGEECCIRYGNEPHEYWSPCNPVNVLYDTSEKIPAYRGAAAMLKELGTFRWEKNRKE